MLRKAIILLSIAALGIQVAAAQKASDEPCFEVASRTYNRLNEALEAEQRARLQKPEDRNLEQDLSRFARKAFVGDPQAALSNALLRIDAAIEQLNAAALTQCLNKKSHDAVVRTLSDARKIDAFLHEKLSAAAAGTSPVDLTAAAYTSFLEKAVDLKKGCLSALIVANFGGG